ncbi:hypothetical protein Amme_076_009 [Acidomonas methanolica NBRC 104435]|uniref:Uncharacterized protein n=1 Tax=Acidomonas methanolica NBRC 104435 TaxID=1231351 RepID=A0A023D7H4_ACIMT|nr:hypothetical protein Amme_076_009 [Acidomonas methanolica NBRC 104435]GEL00046.1 hypothetical protein AME01nite_25440 [Acidomonas methanolica NBRC 104435]
MRVGNSEPIEQLGYVLSAFPQKSTDQMLRPDYHHREAQPSGKMVGHRGLAAPWRSIQQRIRTGLDANHPQFIGGTDFRHPLGEYLPNMQPEDRLLCITRRTDIHMDAKDRPEPLACIFW